MFSKLLPVNERVFERIIRVLIGLLGVSLVFIGPKTPLGYFGLIPLLTGLVGSCPLYTIFGFSTCSRKDS